MLGILLDSTQYPKPFDSATESPNQLESRPRIDEAVNQRRMLEENVSSLKKQAQQLNVLYVRACCTPLGRDSPALGQYSIAIVLSFLWIPISHTLGLKCQVVNSQRSVLASEASSLEEKFNLSSQERSERSARLDKSTG